MKEIEAGEPVQNKRGSWVVIFKEPPRLKLDDIRKAIPKYKLEKVRAKLTVTVAEKDKAYRAGDLALVNGKEADAPDILKEIGAFLKEQKSRLVVRGFLTEDDKGRQTLALTRVDEPK